MRNIGLNARKGDAVIRFLMDENMPHAVRDQLLRTEPTIEIACLGDENAPEIGTPDPEILKWIEEHEYCLVSRNRRTMPDHLANHIADGHHVPGILLIKRGHSLGEVISDLLLVWHAADDDEFRDGIVYVPL